MITLKGNDSEILSLREKAKAIEILIGDVMQYDFNQEHLSEDQKAVFASRYESIAVYLGIVLNYAYDINKAIEAAQTEPVIEKKKQTQPARKMEVCTAPGSVQK